MLHRTVYPLHPRIHNPKCRYFAEIFLRAGFLERLIEIQFFEGRRVDAILSEASLIVNGTGNLLICDAGIQPLRILM